MIIKPQNIELDLEAAENTKKYLQEKVSNIEIESMDLINEIEEVETGVGTGTIEKILNAKDVDLSDFSKSRFKDDTKLKIIEHYTDGKITSMEISSEWGVLFEKIEYENSVIHSRKVYSGPDQLASITYYYDNGKIQSFTEFFEFTNKSKQTTYYDEDGKISVIDYSNYLGEYVERHEMYNNGKKIQEVLYTDNGIKGMETYYDDYGNKIKEVLYTDNDIIAKEIYYDINGNIIKEIYPNEINLDLDGGGNQASFKNTEKLLKDPKILNILKSYFPDASYEDYELYLNKIAETGCGYTALVNTIFLSFQEKKQEFEQTFGFPMYDVTCTQSGVNNRVEINPNYEYLILDFFSWKCKTKNIKTATSSADGMFELDFNQFEDYMKEKFDVSVSITNTKKTVFGFVLKKLGEMYTPPSLRKINKNNFLDVYKSLKTDNNYIILSSKGYNLYTPDKFGDKSPLSSVIDGGAHGMLITGISERGNLLVASWGGIHEVDFSDIGFGDFIDYEVIEYN